MRFKWVLVVEVESLKNYFGVLNLLKQLQENKIYKIKEKSKGILIKFLWSEENKIIKENSWIGQYFVKWIEINKIEIKMSTHEDDDMEHDQEEINVDDVDSDSRISYGSNGSEIDLDGNNSCYDDSETAIK